MRWTTGSGIDLATTRYPRWMKVVWALGFLMFFGDVIIGPTLNAQNHSLARVIDLVVLIAGFAICLFAIVKMSLFKRDH